MDINNLEDSRGWICSLLGWKPPFLLSSLLFLLPEGGGGLGIKEGAGPGQELRGRRQVLRLALLTLRTRVGGGGGVSVTGIIVFGCQRVWN